MIVSLVTAIPFEVGSRNSLTKLWFFHVRGSKCREKFRFKLIAELGISPFELFLNFRNELEPSILSSFARRTISFVVITTGRVESFYFRFTSDQLEELPFMNRNHSRRETGRQDTRRKVGLRKITILNKLEASILSLSLYIFSPTDYGVRSPGSVPGRR